MSVGFIYCLENSCMPGIYKLGKTDRSPTQRCSELSASTSTPAPFGIVFYVEIENALMVERVLHYALDDSRVSANREFFNADPLVAYEWLRCNADIFTEYFSGDMIWSQQQSRSKPLTVIQGGF